ncbi:MAG: ATPase, partial [Lachnospiraceae bacterium]
LTQNKMTVVDYSLGSFKGNGFSTDLDKLSLQEKYFILSSVLSNDSSITPDGKEIGDPTEVALINYSNKCKYNFNEIRKNCKRVWELPFDSDRKLMSTLNDI